MPRMIALVLVVSLGLAAACAPSAPTPSTPFTPSPSAPGAPTPDRTPSASIATPVGSASPVASASPVPSGSSSACAVVTQTGLLPSDRLVNMVTDRTATHDLITFVFATSTPGPGGPPRGTLEAAGPPFSYAGSGAPINLVGEHAIQVRFTNMTLASESGKPVYQGLARLLTNRPPFRDAILFDASEGVIGWYIGYDGPGCVTLERSGDNVTVMIELAGTPPG
jgi:hypothetical protein